MHSHDKQDQHKHKCRYNNLFIGKTTSGFTSSIEYRISNESFKMCSKQTNVALKYNFTLKKFVEYDGVEVV